MSLRLTLFPTIFAIIWSRNRIVAYSIRYFLLSPYSLRESLVVILTADSVSFSYIFSFPMFKFLPVSFGVTISTSLPIILIVIIRIGPSVVTHVLLVTFFALINSTISHPGVFVEVGEGFNLPALKTLLVILPCHSIPKMGFHRSPHPLVLQPSQLLASSQEFPSALLLAYLLRLLR